MTSLGGLALSQIDLGQREEGLANMKIVVETQRARLGDDHPTVAEVEHDLGVALIELGELDRAKAILRKSLATRERVLSPDHRDLATSLADLAHALVADKQYAEARQLLDRFRAMEDAAEPDALERSQVRLDLAQVLAAEGKKREALELAREGVAIVSAGGEGPDAKQRRRELQRWIDNHS